MARYKYSENTKEVTDIYFDTETHGEFMGMEQGGEMKKVTTARIKEKLLGEIVLGVDWQQEILTMTSTPPVSPTEGDRYIVGTSATGAWDGKDNYIAEYTSGAWVFLAPQSRMGVFSYNDMYFLIYLEGEWQLLATLDEITELRDEVQGYRDEILDDPGFQAVSADLIGDDNIGAVADALAIITAVNNNSTNINAVANNKTNINAVNANKANINAVNANKANINAVALNKPNIDKVAGTKVNIDAVAGNSTNINAVALNKVNIDKVATIDAQITALAPIKNDIITVAGKKTEVTALGARTTEIDALYAQLPAIAEKESIANVNTLKGSGWAGQTVKGNADAIALRELLSNKKTTLADNSDTYFPTQKAVNDGLATKTSKSQIAYDNDNTSFIANTLASGAIIERGSNANGKYVKFADGTLVCTKVVYFDSLAFPNEIESMYRTEYVILGTTPVTFIDDSYIMHSQCKLAQDAYGTFAGGTPNVSRTASSFGQTILYAPNNTTKTAVFIEIIAVGRWK